MRARRRRPELPTQNSSADWGFNFPMTKTLAHQLADYTCSVRFEDLSKETVHEVRRRMVDSIGCAIGAWNEEPCKIARSVASEFSAKNGSTIIGTMHQAPPDWANPEKTRHAVNIAGVACAAMRQSRVGELSHWKGVAFADAARRGVYSALLARGGMTGPAPIFEGQMGFEKELGVSLGDLGERFKGPPAMILNTSIKYWPAEYHSQSAIEAALFLREQVGAGVEVKSMTIESHDASVDIIGSEPEKWKPETRETADHSLPYITAIAFIDGEVTERQFQPARFMDPKIWKFLENVKVERNAELSAMYPGAVANIVHVDLADGRRLTKRVDYPLGHAKNPLEDFEVEKKFLTLVAAAFTRDPAAKIIEHVWRLDEQCDVRHLMKLLRVH